MARVNSQMRKRLAHVHAIGDAAMEIKAYDETAPVKVKGYVAQTVAAHWPKWLQQKPGQPESPSARRLISGAYISGPQIVIDLIEQNLVVQGAGNMLIRDYRLPERSSGLISPAPGRASALLGDAAPGSLTGFSPGHTAFTWQNSMSFLNQRNIAVFDHRVEMVHQSGSQLKMTPELAAVTGLDGDGLKQLKGRHVGLSTDHLLVEFLRDRGKTAGGPSTLSKATRLKSFNASGRVHMQEEANDTLRSLDAAEVTYSDDTGLVRANGTARNLAQGMVINQRTGRVEGLPRGSEVEWNVKTGVVRMLDASMIAPGR
jgi:hypothetical protein